MNQKSLPLPLTRLAEEINREISGSETFHSLGVKTRVDRRKLKNISLGKDVPLNFRELTDLNEYFEARGRGMSALFSPPSVIHEIARHGHVTVVLGSYPDKPLRRIDSSRWDIRSLREVLRAMNETGRTVNLAIEDVIWRETAHLDFAKEKVAENESWHKHLDDDGPSVICIGSPKACHATEVMLCRMAKFQEFNSGPTEKAPPFFFTWADDDWRAGKVRSTFQCVSRDLHNYAEPSRELIDDLAEKNSRTCAFFDGELRPVFRRGRDWPTYAVVAAQRRKGNQIWLVLAGVTGPGTLGAAMTLRELAADLPLEARSGHSKLVWATVTSQVKELDSDGYRWDERHVNGRPVLSTLRQLPE